MISAAIAAATSGLRAAQRRSDVGANNIANAQTAGYTRKDVLLSPLVLGGEGRGVMTPGVQRAADDMLARDTRREASKAGYLDVQAKALAAYTDWVGQPQDERSISSRMAALEDGFQKLADTPESATIQRDVITASQSLAGALKEGAAQVRQLREDADANIAREVNFINDALSKLEKLNKEANMRSSTGQDFTEIEDERDRLLDQIAERIPVRTLTRSPNEVVVMTDKGGVLLDGTARQLSFTRTTQVDATLVYDPSGAPPPGFTAGLSGLTLDGQDIAPGSGDAMALQGGSIAGLFAVRDTVMPKVQAQLDEIASALAARFQANDATLAPGQAGLFTSAGLHHDRTVPANIPGMAARIAVNDAVLPEAGGFIWRIRDGIGTAPVGLPPVNSPNPGGHDVQVHEFLKSFADSVTFPAATDLPSSAPLASAARDMVGLQHTARARAEDRAESQALIRDSLVTARESTTGVNTDDELQKMMLIERSYAANAQVIKVASDMLDQLLSIR